MNQDWEEKGIKRLFREMRQEDERLAPSFGRVGGIEVAGGASRRRSVLRFAAAAAFIIVLSGSVWLLAARLSKNAPPSEIAAAPPPAPADQIVADLTPAKTLAPPVDDRSRNSSHRVRRRGRMDAELIAEWRSPTGFLLTTPGGELLMTVPRLGAAAGLKTHVGIDE